MVAKLNGRGRRILYVAGMLGWFALSGPSIFPQSGDSVKADPAALVNPLIGTTNGGNDYPGATLPLGMLAWSPGGAAQSSAAAGTGRAGIDAG